MMKLYYNGNIITLNEKREIVQAMLVDGNIISMTGSNQELLENLDGSMEIIDLQGQTVIPGIIDSHNHVVEAGISMAGVLLFDCKTIADLLGLVAAKAAVLPAGSWIEGAGWIESQFEEDRPPTCWELDQAAPHHPVLLHRLFAGSVANSLALQAAGIEKGSPQPERGTIVCREDGEPNGYLINGAQNAVRACIPRNAGTADQESELMAAIERAGREYLKYGITSLLDPGVGPQEMKAYQKTRNAGKLAQRVAMMPAWYGLYAAQGKDLQNLVPTLGIFEGFGDDYLRLAGLKMAIDGGVGSKTALMNEPWLDGSETKIPLRLDISRLEEYFRIGHRAGWSIGIHCCGDLAQDIACRSFDRIMAEDSRVETRRHHIIHGYLPTQEALEIMRRRDIGVSVQPGFIFAEGDIYFHNLEVERVNRFIPLRTYLANGIRVFANSDMTSAHYNPFLGMRAAVTRRTSRGVQLGSEECIGVMEMLELFIKNGAYYLGLEHQIGSLEPGKLADFAVLSDDILRIDPEKIADLKVLQTVIDGKVVYKSP
ncbi:MAG: amidohydrolase [Negativicutes bacterium]|nr:amidohydrolase [Negativicutes bacterium]